MLTHTSIYSRNYLTFGGEELESVGGGRKGGEEGWWRWRERGRGRRRRVEVAEKGRGRRKGWRWREKGRGRRRGSDATEAKFFSNSALLIRFLLFLVLNEQLPGSLYQSHKHDIKPVEIHDT